MMEFVSKMMDFCFKNDEFCINSGNMFDQFKIASEDGTEDVRRTGNGRVRQLCAVRLEQPEASISVIICHV